MKPSFPVAPEPIQLMRNTSYKQQKSTLKLVLYIYTNLRELRCQGFSPIIAKNIKLCYQMVQK